MELFNKRLVNQAIEKSRFLIAEKDSYSKDIITKIQDFLIKDKNRTKEKPIQSLYLQRIFEKILVYPSQLSGLDEYNLIIEPTTDYDSTEPDGALGFFNEKEKAVKAVIELKPSGTDLDKKQTSRKDQKTPVEQGFGYSYKFDGCKWVIISNFTEIRLYSTLRGIEFYEQFNIFELHQDDEFKKFHFLLCKKNLISKAESSVIERLTRETSINEENITKEFYKIYKDTRMKLFNHLVQNNSQIDKYIILEKAQKILDRVLFISFCEDLGLLPYNIFRNILKSSENSFDTSETKTWNQVKGLFFSINQGNSNKNINKFNGGLFADDAILDNLIIKDEVTKELLGISDYDFESDLNVNILGHIFEQSISDIEEMKTYISEVGKPETGKRKKEGIYYTPDYITKYIVESAIGSWLEFRKKELGFETLPRLTEKDYSSIKLTKGGKSKVNKKVEKNINFWEKFREILSNIKILDPACGSGAFLIQAFDFLYKEGQLVNDELAKLKSGQKQIFDLDKHILTNNIFGVDLNEESVQITKLSLWLKTANREKELTALDDNIKCGNSLIGDNRIDASKVFKWKFEFRNIINNGGFDVIIGNPPYISSLQLTKQFGKNIKIYWKNKFNSAVGTYDIYILFFEQGIKLLNEKGILSYITPNKYLSAPYGEGLRKYIKNNCKLLEILDFSKIKVFEDPAVYPIITVLQKTNPKKYYFKIKECLDITNQIMKEAQLSSEVLEILPDHMFSLVLSKHPDLIIKILKNSTQINKIAKVSATSTAAESDEFSEYILENSIEGMTIVNTGTIDRYLPLWGYKEMSNKGEKFLKPKLNINTLKLSKHRLHIYRSPKIIFAKISNKIEVFLDKSGEYASINTNCVYDPFEEYPLEFLLGIINSKLMNFFYNECFNALRMSGGYLQFQAPQIKVLPIKNNGDDIKIEIKTLVNKLIDRFEKKLDILKNSSDILSSEFKLPEKIKKVEELLNLDWLELTNKLQIKGFDLTIKKREEFREWFLEKQEKIRNLEYDISEIDKTIDQKVYCLYGLLKDEENIIESSNR